MPIDQEILDQLQAIAFDPIRAEVDGVSASREKLKDLVDAFRDLGNIDPNVADSQKVGFKLQRFTPPGAP